RQTTHSKGTGITHQQLREEPRREAELKSARLQYANAMADVALVQGVAEPASKQLNGFGAAYAESAELRTFLASPAVSIEEKHVVIEKIVARLGASKIIRNFLFVLTDHRRTQLIPEAVTPFHH